MKNRKHQAWGSLSNPFSRGGGAGFAVAKMPADKSVHIVIGGAFGEKMEDALKSRGVKYREMRTTVRQGILQVIEEEKNLNRSRKCLYCKFREAGCEIRPA
ncbi:MAG: hypothetical protein JW836_06300 [Deltaproteobacteria bacterium]|nr:hypothetical protein [Deltaproteobacteria bacterium]